MRTKLRGFLCIPEVYNPKMKYTLPMISGQYTASLWRLFMKIHGCFETFQTSGFQEGRAALGEKSYLKSDRGQTTGHHVFSWTGLTSGRMGVETDPSHWDCRCWGEVLERWEMLLQPPATAGLPLSHGAMGWALDRRWQQRNVAAVNLITRGSLGPDCIPRHVKKHFITVWDAASKIKLQ